MAESVSETFSFSGRRRIRPEIMREAIKAAMDPRINTEPEKVQAEIYARLGKLGITPERWREIVQQSLRASR